MLDLENFTKVLIYAVVKDYSDVEPAHKFESPKLDGMLLHKQGHVEHALDFIEPLPV